MRPSKLLAILATIVFALAGRSVLAADTLTILWAEWDPANYLQELVKDYEKQSGVKVVVETVPWPDFQTKAFTEFNAKGSAYDMVVGDSQWIGAASEAGHYVDLSEFFAKHKLAETMAPATVKYYSEYPAASGKYWSVPAEGDAVGWRAYCSGPEAEAEAEDPEAAVIVPVLSFCPGCAEREVN